MLKVLAAFGALAVIGAGFLVYLFSTAAFASSRARTDSVALLESVRTHGNDAYAALRKLPTFDASATTPDFAQAKQTADQYAATLSADRTGIRADEAELRADDDRLTTQEDDLFALPFRPALDHERLRAEGMLSAVQAEDTGLGIEVDQMHGMSAIFDAENDLYSLVVNHFAKQDFAGSLALFPGLDAKLETARQASSGRNNAPQAQQLVTNMQTLSADLDAFSQAAQRRDLGALLALQPKIEGDSTAFQSFDSQGLDSYDQTLLQPYESRFDAGVRAAGFTPETSAAQS